MTNKDQTDSNFGYEDVIYSKLEKKFLSTIVVEHMTLVDDTDMLFSQWEVIMRDDMISRQGDE